MNTYKILAIFFAVFTVGAINETFRIFSSNEADIAENRSSLIPMSIGISLISLLATLYFWKKSKKTN